MNSIEQLQQQIAADPENGDLHFALGKAFLLRLNDSISHVADLQEAKQHLQKAAKLNPVSANIYRYLGMAYERSADLHNALRQYEHCLLIAPENTTYQREAGQIRLKIAGEQNNNLQHHRKAIAVDPSNTMKWRLLGNAYSQKGMFEDALLCYRKAIALEPREEEHHYFLGLALQDAGLHDEAIEAFNKSLKLSTCPEGTEMACHASAVSHFALADYEAAIVLYQKELATAPDSPVPYAGMADSYKALKQYDKAIELYRQAIELDTDHLYCDLATAIGECYYMKKDHRKAQQWLEQAVKTHPTGYQALHNLGVILLQNKDYEGMVMVSRMALQANCHYLPAINNLGLGLMKLGEYREAIEILEQGLALDANHLQCLFLSAELQTLIGNYDKAYDLYNRYLDILIEKIEERGENPDPR